jgi:methionine sulfoxide reductase heme-binding subunit
MKKTISLMSLLALFNSTTATAAAQTINVKDVPAQITETYIVAFLFMVFFIVITIIIANLIKFEGGTNPKDPGKRRLWFWVMAILAPITFYLYNFFMVIPMVRTGPAMNKFFMHVPIASGLVLLLYVITGFVLAKMMSRGKIGNWFPAKK